jgi:NADH dehydrogenase FAD-containing subunit
LAGSITGVTGAAGIIEDVVTLPGAVENDVYYAVKREINGSTVRYDRLLLATGTTARSWTVPGGRHTHVMRDVADAKRLRATLNSGSCVVLIGTGFIAWNWRRARWPEAAA